MYAAGGNCHTAVLLFDEAEADEARRKLAENLDEDDLKLQPGLAAARR